MNSPTTPHEQAENNLTAGMKIACCKICLLSEAMKDCKHCIFNIGLPARMDGGLKPVKVSNPELSLF